jgi:uncharacterized membrane protein
MWRKLAGIGLAMALAFSVTEVASARHGGGGREGGFSAGGAQVDGPKWLR